MKAFIFISTICIACFTLSAAKSVIEDEIALGNPRASSECKSIYGREVPVADFQNYGCKLMCVVNNKIFYHSMFERQNCPGKAGTKDKDMLCHNGDCVQKIITSDGHLDIEIIRGELPDMDPAWGAKPDGYVIACIQNDTGPIERPLTHRGGCDCRTKTSMDNNYPEWRHKCSNWPKDETFPVGSRIILEAWDYDSPDPDDFIGSIDFTVNELTKNRKNGVEQVLDIWEIKNNKAEKHGKLTVKTTWTHV